MLPAGNIGIIAAARFRTAAAFSGIDASPSFARRLRTTHTTAIAAQQLEPTLKRISASAAAVDEMAVSVNRAGAQVGNAADVAASGVQQLRGETLPDVKRLVGELNQLAGALRRLSEQTERSPSSLLLGAPTRPPGPGEKAQP